LDKTVNKNSLARARVKSRSKREMIEGGILGRKEARERSEAVVR